MLSKADALAICDAIADYTLDYPNADHTRRATGTAIILGIASRLAHVSDRLLLTDTWTKRQDQPRKVHPPEPRTASGSLD